jgi:hypothetical protein
MNRVLDRQRNSSTAALILTTRPREDRAMQETGIPSTLAAT